MRRKKWRGADGLPEPGMPEMPIRWRRSGERDWYFSGREG